MSKTMKARCILQVQLDIEYDVEAIKALANVTQERIEEVAREAFVYGGAVRHVEEMLRETAGFGENNGDGTTSSAKVQQTYGDVWFVPEVVN